MNSFFSFDTFKAETRSVIDQALAEISPKFIISYSLLSGGNRSAAVRYSVELLQSMQRYLQLRRAEHVNSAMNATMSFIKSKVK